MFINKWGPKRWQLHFHPQPLLETQIPIGLLTNTGEATHPQRRSQHWPKSTPEHLSGKEMLFSAVLIRDPLCWPQNLLSPQGLPVWTPLRASPLTLIPHVFPVLGSELSFGSHTTSPLLLFVGVPSVGTVTFDSRKSRALPGTQQQLNKSEEWTPAPSSPPNARYVRRNDDSFWKI